MSLEDVKALTGDNPQVDVIYKMTAKRLMRKLASLTDVDKAMLDLEHIIDEVTIARFNRVGSEGMQAETVEGYSVSFRDDDVFSSYEDEINVYISEHLYLEEQGGIKFL